MSSSLSGVLAIYEREVIFPVLLDVGEGHLNVIALNVNDRIERILREVFPEQILESILGSELLSVVTDGQTAIQVGVIPEHAPDVLVAVAKLLKHLGIRSVGDEGAIRFRTLLVFLVDRQGVPAGILNPSRFSFPEGLNVKIGGQRVHRLDSHSIQTDRLLEGLGIVLRSGVYLGRAIKKFFQGNPPTMISNGYGLAIGLHANLLPETHDELVNAIIQNLLEQNVNAIILGRTVSKLADVHARANRMCSFHSSVLMVSAVYLCSAIFSFHPVHP